MNNETMVQNQQVVRLHVETSIRATAKKETKRKALEHDL